MTTIDLFDNNYDCVGTESIDGTEMETPVYERTIKWYYDREINPDRELFTVRFDGDGELIQIYFNNYHHHPDGQESIVFDASVEDLLELRNLTGISENLANYYTQVRVTPMTDLP